jgi:hypothetical protein
MCLQDSSQILYATALWLLSLSTLLCLLSVDKTNRPYPKIEVFQYKVVKIWKFIRGLILISVRSFLSQEWLVFSHLFLCLSAQEERHEKGAEEKL